MASRNLVCVILVAGHAQQLRQDIEVSNGTPKEQLEDESGKYVHLKGLPKALLPAPRGKRILDHWWDAIKTRQLFSDVFLVTNADKYKHFERWATASDFPVENIVNDGSTIPDNALGSVADVELAIRTKNLWENDILVIAGDMLFQDSKFDMAQVLDYFYRTPDGDLAIYYEMESSEPTFSRGIVEVCPKTNRISKFIEKPAPHETHSRNASVVFYTFRSETVSRLPVYLQEYQSSAQRTFGSFMQWLINDLKVLVYGMKLPTGFQLIGQVGLKDYESWNSYFADQARKECKTPRSHRAYARVGIMGNPSDGFFGKTISLSIANFWAEVTIKASANLRLLPHPLNDPTEFGSLSDLYGISNKEGYLGGLRLLQATCKKFYNFCATRGIALTRQNFTLSYDTNIPRQVGLAGSSAIVTATLKCLMDFFNLTDHDMPKTLQPQFILEVEKEELRINAGLQDRVVQIYEGLVHMDFTRSLMESQGHGNYVHLGVDLPPLFLVYLPNPSDSGKIHSDVAARWERGDEKVLAGMKQFAELTDEATKAIKNHDWSNLADLMNANFGLRRELYGDAALGVDNLRMIEIGRSFGAAVKFPGSGGAVLGLLNDQSRMEELRHQYQQEGCVVVDIIPNKPV
ncbi:probable glucuronokinase 2 isoform X1 [Penaeus japonicus]|uniref:probable glucuronokinase 2 isoform X1 n=1 Tax=Penaeus japonicus TaxID=27405 RepID=UPI001C7161AF|nr:probable glucuronokinase 2 isoform X1 [Penaeus japonicus]